MRNHNLGSRDRLLKGCHVSQRCCFEQSNRCWVNTEGIVQSKIPYCDRLDEPFDLCPIHQEFHQGMPKHNHVFQNLDLSWQVFLTVVVCKTFICDAYESHKHANVHIQLSLNLGHSNLLIDLQSSWSSWCQQFANIVHMLYHEDLPKRS